MRALIYEVFYQVPHLVCAHDPTLHLKLEQSIQKYDVDRARTPPDTTHLTRIGER